MQSKYWLSDLAISLAHFIIWIICIWINYFFRAKEWFYDKFLDDSVIREIILRRKYFAIEKYKFLLPKFCIKNMCKQI